MLFRTFFYGLFFAASTLAYGSELSTKYSSFMYPAKDTADVVMPAGSSAGGGVVLVGGGTDFAEVFQWMIQRMGVAGDFVILRADVSEGYNSWIYEMGGVQSVETLVVPSREAAFDPYIAQQLRNAEAIFIPGGNQGNYVNFWQGTPVEGELNAAAQRGAPLGGTSAGLAILGEFLHSAQAPWSVTSDMALTNPYDSNITLMKDFLRLPYLGSAGTLGTHVATSLITDSHFVERNRMGRLVSYMARIVQDMLSTTLLRGVGVDRQSALAIETRGAQARLAKVLPNPNYHSVVYMLSVAHRPVACAPGKPLVYERVPVYRLHENDMFDMVDFTPLDGRAPDYRLSTAAGKVFKENGDASPY